MVKEQLWWELEVSTEEQYYSLQNKKGFNFTHISWIPLSILLAYSNYLAITIQWTGLLNCNTGLRNLLIIEIIGTLLKKISNWY